ncbi:MAG: hypothetical protein JXB07_19860, partial [Anaerolineae bacterium]|nr:hypothetical protein [Anaerolineae bacterium]
QINGIGFQPNLPLIVRLGLPATGLDNTVYGSVVSDASGSFVAQFTMPATWPDGAPIVETSLVVVITNGDGNAKAGAEFVYVPATVQQAPAVDVCYIRNTLAPALGLAPDQLGASESDVVDPVSGVSYSGCVLRFDVRSQSPMDVVRTALGDLGWREDAAGSTDGVSVFRTDIGLLVVRVSEAKCTETQEDGTCLAENIYYTISIGHVTDTTSQ